MSIQSIFSITICFDNSKLKNNNHLEFLVQLQKDLSKEYNTKDEFMKAIDIIKFFFKTTVDNGFHFILRLTIDTSWFLQPWIYSSDETDETMIYILINLSKNIYDDFLFISCLQQKEFMDSIYYYTGPCNKKWTERLINARQIKWKQNISQDEKNKETNMTFESICSHLYKLTFQNVKVDFNEIAIQFPNLEELCLDTFSISETKDFKQMIEQLTNYKHLLKCLHLDFRNISFESAQNLINISTNCLETEIFPCLNIGCLKITPFQISPFNTDGENIKGDLITGLIKFIKTDHLLINSNYLAVPFLKPGNFKEVRQFLDSLMIFKKVDAFFHFFESHFDADDKDWLHRNHKWLYLNLHLFARPMREKIIKKEMFEEVCRGLNQKTFSETPSPLTSAFGNHTLFERHTIPIIFDFI